MHWKRLKSLKAELDWPGLAAAARFGRSAIVLGAAAAAAGGMVLGAGAAQAAIGKDPGAVQLSATTGATSTTPTWSTSTACASGFQGSAVFREVHSDGTTTNNISPIVNGTASPFSGTLQASIAQIQGAGGIANGGTQELVVICFSGASGTGNADPEMDIAIHYSADGSSYITDTNFGGGGGPATTTTTLTASPSTANVGQSVTLTATEVASDSTHPAGSVQFENGSSAIGTPVAVNANGVATTTTSFAAAGTDSLSAVFTPTSTTAYSGSTGTASVSVTSGGGGGNSGTEPLAVTVPSSGTFTLTVGAGTVNLTVSGSNATGVLNPITVADTRNSSPGFSVSGQAADFTGSGTAASSTISGNQLGWVPTDTSLGTGVTLGGTVAPGSPGLGTTAAVLAQAHAGSGFGTSALGANMTLAIPASALAGDYTSSLTVTAVTALP